MFYKMIEAKRNEWLSSPECVVKDLLAYIEHTAQMRDAQTEAIKTYLFLKINCDSKPLYELFCQGYFNSMDFNAAALTTPVRDYLRQNPAAAALYEYACLKDDEDNLLSEKLKRQIEDRPEDIDYGQFFRAL